MFIFNLNQSKNSIHYTIKVLLCFVCLHLFLWTSISFSETLQESGELDHNDPFIDYSEFDSSALERADVEFFKTGRFINFGVYGGGRVLLGEVTRYTRSWWGFGFFIAYFLNLNTSLQFSFLNSDHPSAYPISHEGSTEVIRAITTYRTFDLSLKYYINPQKLVRAVAFFNPHFFAGGTFGVNVNRTHFDDNSQPTRLSQKGFGAKIGAGLEVRLFKALQIGTQIDFAYIQFDQEGQRSSFKVNDQDEDTQSLTIEWPVGDFFNTFVYLGYSF